MNLGSSRRIWLLGFLLLLAGCANLQEVRDFAGQSAQLAAYPELTHRWAGTYQREKLYLFDNDLALSLAEDKDRQEAVQDVLKIHETVSVYFALLGELAGDKTFPVGKNMDGLAKQIKKSHLAGVKEEHVEAYADIVTQLTSWFLKTHQQKEIAVYLEQGNAPIQQMLDGMSLVVRAYQGTLRNEIRRMGFLNLVEKKVAQDKIVAALANIEYARFRAEADAAQKRLAQLTSAIEIIKRGHQKLYESRIDLTRDEIKMFLKLLNKSLKSIRTDLHALEG